MRMLVLALQAATPATPLPPIDFDLAEVVRRPKRCGDASSREIVVCARRRDADRLKPIPGAAELDRPEDAEIDLPGGMKGGAVAESASVGGFPSNRFMVRIRTPF